MASALSFAVQTWVIDRAGPVFVSVYLPIQTLLVALMASVVLGEEFYLGGWASSLLLNISLFKISIDHIYIHIIIMIGSCNILQGKESLAK